MENTQSSGRREFYIAAAASVLIDQASKLVVSSLLPAGDSITVIPGVFDIRSQSNTGAAFGLMEKSGPLLILISLVAIFAIVKFRRERTRGRLLAVSLGMLLGGAVGNLIDRIARPGVFDFLDFQVWPVFNVADIAITVGGGLLFLHTLFGKGRSAED